MNAILSDTLAPPMIAEHGRFGIRHQPVDDFQFLGDEEADDARLAPSSPPAPRP